MILRLFRATVRPGAETEMLRRLRTEARPGLHRYAGLHSFTTGFRHDGERTQHLALSTWSDLDAIRAIAGCLDRSIVSAQLDDIFESIDIDHYELVDVGSEGAVQLDGPVVGVVTAHVAPDADASAIDTVRRSRDELREAGVVAFHVGRRIRGRDTELAILAVWRDRPSLHRFARRRDGALIAPAFTSQMTSWSFETWDCLSPERPMIPPAGPAVLLADDDARYVDASPGIEAVLGVPGELLLRRSVADVTAPGLRHGFAAAWASFLGERQQAGNYELALPDGREVRIRYRAKADVPEPGLHASVLSREDDPPDGRSVEELVRIAFRPAAVSSTPAGPHDPAAVSPT